MVLKYRQTAHRIAFQPDQKWPLTLSTLLKIADPTRMPEFVTAATEDDFREARRLLREYEDFVEVDLCFQGFEEELGNLEQVYGPPGGRFLLLRQGGQTAGCVALRDLGNGICEMKRLFLRSKFRGKGLGRLCAERIIQTAKEMGFVAMRLDTLPIMREAIDLYRSMGFREISTYAENPVQGALCMELQLTRD